MSTSTLNIKTVATKPFDGQKPGTSGLRKKVTEVRQPHYLENFVQAIWDALPEGTLKGATLVVAGDGRYYNTEALTLIIRMAAAQGITKIVTGVNGLMSTPCVSGVIRSLKAYGGIILTASHNPGGPTEDFGIKYNAGNGGPAPESLTDLMFAKTKTITQYLIAEQTPTVDFSKIGCTSFGSLTIEVIDAAQAYSQLMRSIFDFSALSKFVQRKDFRFIYDAMHGVAGPFATQIFVKDLGASPECLLNAVPKLDFGGGHPDPNLTYAAELVHRLGLSEDIKIDHGDDDHGHAHGGHGHSHGGHGHSHGAPATSPADIPDFGAAADGDADRNMILGRQFFVTPSDSVAIIAANYQYIPYFKNGLKGVARSMPTSAALDRVAQKIGVKCYEVPTGWKFFGNLMDASQLSICGEESFGTGSDHIREKDGMWAVLCWLSILEGKNRDSKPGHLVSVKDIVTEHWKTYGRNYYSRYDYEGVDSAAANKVVQGLVDLIPKVESKELTTLGDFKIATLDEFTYHDPVDKSVSAHQGVRLIFSDGSRIVYRLSGTGSVGATIRVYIERYEADPSKLEQVTATALEPLIAIALDVSKIRELTGRQTPTVIT